MPEVGRAYRRLLAKEPAFEEFGRPLWLGELTGAIDSPVEHDRHAMIRSHLRAGRLLEAAALRNWHPQHDNLVWDAVLTETDRCVVVELSDPYEPALDARTLAAWPVDAQHQEACVRQVAHWHDLNPPTLRSRLRQRMVRILRFGSPTPG